MVIVFSATTRAILTHSTFKIDLTIYQQICIQLNELSYYEKLLITDNQINK